MRNTADVTGGKPIAVLLQSISDVSAINPLVAFYDIHGGKREVLFFYLDYLLLLFSVSLISRGQPLLAKHVLSYIVNPLCYVCCLLSQIKLNKKQFIFGSIF
jgi:hypothetical protein